MAAKSQHVQDSAVIERRLRPIYDWLDTGNPKKALQETEKVLKKSPQLQCARALKALALLQLGRETECDSLLNTLIDETPTDNSTLQAITICYRDLGQLEKVCELYEKAITVDQNNEELHTHLFMSYVRTSNYKMQQQSALVLYKLKPKNPYYFWAVMSIVLQATRGPGLSDPNKRTVLLSLAERMVSKLIGEQRIEAEQEVQLYLMILEMQAKYEQALYLLDNGTLNITLTYDTVDQHRIPYLLKLQRWHELNALCMEILRLSMDRWDIWNHYLTSTFKLARTEQQQQQQHSVNNHTTESGDSNTIDELAERAHEFICSLIETGNEDSSLFKSGSNYALRGPYLARFELCVRLKQFQYDPVQLLGDTFELFVEYFRLFGHKSCCVSDLRVYLHLLEPKRRLELASRLLKDVGISSTTLPCTQVQMQRHICSLQLTRLCGHHRNLDHEYLKALITALSLHYQNGAQTFGADRLPTDQGPADPYALLATHTLYDLAVATKSSTPLITALMLLENLLKRSPSNFHAKLLCVRLYHLLGGGEGAHKMYESLDTKHLQLDSLGFVHCNRMYGTGLFSLAANLYDTTLKFFSTNYRDSIDHLTFSYKFGSFMKLEEFMNFRERLNNSLHYTMTAIDRMLLEMVLCPILKGLNIIDASPKNNNIDWDALRDNSNYDVYLSWDPERVESSIEKSQNHFDEDKDLARIRAAILCCVSSALDVIKSSDENREQCVKTLEDVFRNMSNTMEAIESKYCNDDLIDSKRRELSMPLPSRLRTHLKSPYRKILGTLFQLVIETVNIKKEINEDLSQDVQTSLQTLGEQIEHIVQEQNTSDDNLWKKCTSMEVVVNAVEILSISSFLCGICSTLQRSGSQTRKTKKKSIASEQSSSSSMASGKNQLIDLIGSIRQTCIVIDKLLDNWQPPKDPSDLSDRLCALGLTSDDNFSMVLVNLRASHNSAIKELHSVLNNKIKYLNTLIGS